MDKHSKIYLAGHTGLVGSALHRGLKKHGYNNIIVRTLQELDLTSQAETDNFFNTEKPGYVFLAAAKVGGIMANSTYRAEFIYENLMIQANVIHASWKTGVRKLLFLGSTCIYPRNTPQPMKESYLLTGPLERTNEPYAIAKIAGLKMCENYNLQFGTDFIAVMPTNLYGDMDNFDLEKSHVLPAILRKVHLAACLERDDWPAISRDLDYYPIEGITGKSKKGNILGVLEKYGIHIDMDGNKLATVTLWGTGTPLREFMYSEEMASACIYIMENITAKDIITMNGGTAEAPQFINIGTGNEIAISDLADLIKYITGYNGNICFDPSKPDGTIRKLTDVSTLKKLGFESEITLEQGIRFVYEKYLKYHK